MIKFCDLSETEAGQIAGYLDFNELYYSIEVSNNHLVSVTIYDNVKLFFDYGCVVLEFNEHQKISISIDKFSECILS